MVGEEEIRSPDFSLATLQTPFERAELQRCRLTATQQRADASLELGELEWLRHVVVGPAVEPLHAILGAVSRGEDQHGGGLSASPEALEHRQAIELRQAEIEHDEIELLGRKQRVGVVSVSGDHGLMPGTAKGVS